ncbi:NACHT domain-containing protein [Comamonas composti]|uniref:hypothetical protein n=1 Tax=Comamonas composti TaxID=408558 RepID=UPI00040BC7BF|nr:hypothetical protein [Comamonas composti]
MSTPFRRELEEIYKRYGFETAKLYDTENVVVFTLKTGYFDNADIVPLSEDAQTEKAFKDFSTAGFACTVRSYLTAKQTEYELFKGFFSVSSILDRLKRDYSQFTNGIVRPFADDAKYTYINAPYSVNGKIGELSPADEVVSRLGANKPMLFLIEAAAGFGKTCTAYEIVRLLIDNAGYLPLFSELSRNRKAPIFRYVLLDEIDRKFPTLSSRLVQNEMVNGRIVTILDGFDELLRKADDTDEFDKHEPMLETIGQFLTGNAKIVLTTRRTVLFEGDAFHTWAANNADNFELVRIKIGEPSISDWLSEERLNAINATAINIKGGLSNPVLLSYLRCIPREKFDAVVQSPQDLVEKYFSFLLEREQTRQDLKMSVGTQKSILAMIAGDMISQGYTSEQRDYIVDLVQRSCLQELEASLALYPAAERPDREFLANKIASHALLDRSSKEESKIGFINEFVLGYFVSTNILRHPDWLNDDIRFLEPAVTSYGPRSNDEKAMLLDRIRNSLEFTSVSYRIDFTAKLSGGVDFLLSSDEAEGLDLANVSLGTLPISDFQFNDCTFRNCQFLLSTMANVTFLNCKFYGSNTAVGISDGKIYLLGESGDTVFLRDAIQSNVAEPEQLEDYSQLTERHVLEKFWPIGREKLMHKHRPISGICTASGEYKPNEMFEAVVRLKKAGLLLQPNHASFVELNFERLPEIRQILGRQ